MKFATYTPITLKDVLSENEGLKLNLPSQDLFSSLYIPTPRTEPAVQTSFLEDTGVKVIDEVESKSNSQTMSIPPTTKVEKQIPIKKDQPKPKRENPFKVNDALLGFLDLAESQGINLKITSGLREGAMTKSGKPSHHGSGSAMDIVPGEGETWDTLFKKVRENPLIHDYLRSNKLGILDETTPEMLKRTGGTGAHWHLGPDQLALKGLEKIIKGQEGLKFATYNQIDVPVQKVDALTYKNLLPHINKYLKQDIKKVEPQPIIKDENLEDLPLYQENPIKIQQSPKIESSSKKNLNITTNDKDHDAKILKNMGTIKKIAERLKDAGYNDHQIHGVLGSLYQESNFGTEAVSQAGAYGIAQWLGPRLENLKKYAIQSGKPIKDLDTQIDFLIKEMGDSKSWLRVVKEKGKKNKAFPALEEFTNAQNVEEAMNAFTNRFERPGDSEAMLEKRLLYSNFIGHHLNKNNEFKEEVEKSIEPFKIMFDQKSFIEKYKKK